MEETTPLAVCKHIRENVDVSKLLFKGCHFNAIVNNADFFSGLIYSDGGTMYWGTIQQRTDSIDNCQLYKYFSSGGADTVIPFKKNETIIPNIVGGASNTNTVTYTPDWEHFNRIHVVYTCENYYCFCSFNSSGTMTKHYSRWGSYPVTFKKSGSNIIITGSGGSSPNHISIIPYNV